MERNLVLLFDGTWNDRKDQTNVLRMRQSIDSTGEDDPLQPCRYLGGVGTSWHNRLTGGLFGRGLSENIKQGYAWLARHHRAGDRIFVFGFSRGAYSARSCVGLIRKCGLLKSVDEDSIEKAYELYRDKDVAPKDEDAVKFRAANSREVRVRFIGVWDTVGSLGVPLARIPFSSDYYRWHDTRLSKIVDFAYHAVALDERRKHYDAALWTEQKPDETREVEQRWFIGAHANVGGGYEKKPPDCLANITLRWMQDKAEGAGLKLASRAEVADHHCLAPLNDSHAEFAYGLYQRIWKPAHRAFGKGVNEKVDLTVWNRWKRDKAYRPGTLNGHPECPSAEDEIDLSAVHPG
jgi:uncharacterized protein (DUF2235 family)